MSAAHQTFLLTLPSGGTVQVRKPDRLAYLSRNVLLFPLLAAALDSVPTTGSSAATPPDEFALVNAVCRAALIDADLLADLSVVDRLDLHNWALSPDVEPARPYEVYRWGVRDLLGLVRTPAAILVDATAKRYGKLPSELLDLTDAPELAMDLDMAVAFRGARLESGSASGASDGSGADIGDVTVKDGFGFEHTIPASWLQGKPTDGQVIHMDDVARRYGAVNLSVGGSPDGDLAVWQ